MHKMKLLLSLLLITTATLSGCRSRSQTQGADFQGQQTAVPLMAQRFQATGRSRDLSQWIQQYHAPLVARNPVLIDLKYQAMKDSPFAFYRATAFLFYQDMAAQNALNQAVKVPLQGDLHLENMGTYRMNNGDFAYDLNDFDEAVTGPFTWDIARMGTSIYLAAEEVGLKKSEQQGLSQYFLSAYQRALEALQQNPALLKTPLNERYLSEKPANQVSQARERFDRAAWLTSMAPNGRFALGTKIQAVPAAERIALQQAIEAYTQTRREGAAFFRVKDAAVRIAGKGSLGRYRYVVLVEGATPAAQDDLILEFKEATSPSANYAGRQLSNGNDGQRIVSAYRQFLPQVDPYLGVTRLGALSAYVRELLPDESVNLDKVNKVGEYQDFLDSVALIVARAHSHSGQGARILQELPQYEKPLLDFMQSYKSQVDSDYESFRRF